MGIFIRDAGLALGGVSVGADNVTEAQVDGVQFFPTASDPKPLDPDTYVNDTFEDEINRNLINHTPVLDVVGNGWQRLLNSPETLLCRYGGVLPGGNRSISIARLGWHAACYNVLTRSEHVIDVTGMSALDPLRPVSRTRAFFAADPINFFWPTAIFASDPATGYYDGITIEGDGIWLRQYTTGQILTPLKTVTWAPGIQLVLIDVNRNNSTGDIQAFVEAYDANGSVLQTEDTGLYSSYTPSAGVSVNYPGIETASRGSCGCFSFRASPISA